MIPAAEFAAQLAADLHDSAPRCGIAWSGRGGPVCGRIAGRVRIDCANGHSATQPICADCLHQLRTSPGLHCHECFTAGVVGRIASFTGEVG